VHFDCRFVTIERSGFLARAYVGKGENRIHCPRWQRDTITNGFGDEGRPSKRERGHRHRQQVPAFVSLRYAVEEAMAGRLPLRFMAALHCRPRRRAVRTGVLSRYWRETLQAAGIRHIKLHAARHTCATLMHRGVDRPQRRLASEGSSRATVWVPDSRSAEDKRFDDFSEIRRARQ
jgi:integrase